MTAGELAAEPGTVEPTRWSSVIALSLAMLIVTSEMTMAAVTLPGVGAPRDPDAVPAAAGLLLGRLAWWARALRAARAAQPYVA
jgi:DHA2 family multidrug resistance protein-like MFS transporter